MEENANANIRGLCSKLLNAERIQKMFEQFAKTTDCTITFFSYPDNECVLSTEYQSICLKFHGIRQYQKTTYCQKYPQIIKQLNENLIKKDKIKIYCCDSGLTDGVIPVFAKNVRIGTLLAGQIILGDQKTKKEKISQKSNALDGRTCLNALNRVPIISKKKFQAILTLLAETTSIIIEQGLDELHTIKTKKNLSTPKKILDRILENTSDVMWTMDMDLNLTFVTPSVEKITGIPIEQYLKRSIEEKYPQSSLEKIRSLIKEELKNEKKQSVERTRNKIIEIQEYKADGSLVWISINASFIRDKNGAPIGFQGVTRDITAKKDAEEKLRKNKEKLLEINTVLTSLGSDYNKNINNLTSLAGRILKSTCAIYNRLENGTLYSAGQWQTPEDYNPKDKPEGHICFDVIKQAEQKPFILKNLPKSKYAETDPNVTKYGLQTYVGFPVFCGREIIGCLCVVFQDNVELEEEDTRVLGLLAAALKNIEEQKKSKQEKEELQKQLLQAKKMEAVGTLAGGISHDFNNLLQIITGYIEIIKLDTKPDSDNYRRLEGIEKSAAKGANLVNQLLHFSRKKEIARQPLNLNQEIAKTEIIFKRTIPKTISIEYNLDSQLWNINADSSQIGQVLLNLISNASDAMRGSGKLSIKTKNMHLKSQDCEILPGNYVVLSISDTGEGMDKNTAQNIFDPFFTTKETGKGTGLGLATVYGIVTSHNGYIKYTSQPGRGTRFDIYLPAEKNLELNEKEKTANQPATGNKTILIVDDEDQIREITEINLSKLGYKTLQAPDGRKAVKTYQNQKEEIDLIILDINMPNMDGIECMRQLLKINPKAKIILASGYPLNPENAQEIAGHAGTMQKPFTKNDLSAKLKEVLN